jgi:membrane protein implicated in regulation of membrane protease activity
MVAVVFVAAPFKVAYSIVISLAVLVINHWIVLRVLQERLSHKSVRFKLFGYTIYY